jgi:cyclic pyranopterin phosphate synthase
MPVLDRLDRPMRDLRVSVTDRCNLRCVYCMPRDVFGASYRFLERSDLLSFEEITRLVRLFAERGVTKIRLTGGEPLLRRRLEDLVGMLAAVEGIEDIALTTNGLLLADRAAALHEAGLRRVTVSLDALDDATAARVADTPVKVERVLAAIEAASAAGLAPVKVNAVIKRGLNEHAVLDLCRAFRGTPHVVRFIEYMDVGTSNGWRLEEVVPATEILAAIEAEFPVEPLAQTTPGEVAERYRYRDGAGEVGVIASVTRPFCGACTRARLTAEGHLYTCLFGAAGHDLRGPMREGASDDVVGAFLDRIWSRRRDRYSELRTEATTAERPRVEMSHIGG